MYLGIDLGTSTLKALLSDESGAIVASVTKDYPLLIPEENWTEQNPYDWYNALIYCLKELAKGYDLKSVKGISFCGQMHGLVILDDNDNVIRPAILWNDNRTVKECDYLNNTIGRQNLIEWTGNIAFTGFTAPKVLWLKNNEINNFNKISKIMLPKDYLVYKITGRFVSDVSDCSGTLFFDVKNKCWSENMLEVLHIKETQLPKVYESYESVGKVSDDFAKVTGLSTETSVIAGGGDQAVGALGTGTIYDNMLSISLGTSGVVFASSDKYNKVESGAMHSFCHANGRYHVMGVMLSAAGSLEWWVKDILKTKDFKEIDASIANCKSSNLIFLPYLSGERTPINDVNARGMFFGLNLSHKQEDLSRAVMEGVCLGLLDCMKAIEELGIKPQSGRVIGGGAKSEIWLQMLSDTLGLKLFTMNTAEGGGIGAIILSMVGCKKFSSIEEGCSNIISVAKEFSPDMDKHQYYQAKYKEFKRLYFTLKD